MTPKDTTQAAPPRVLFDVQAAAGYLRSLGADAVTVGFIRTLINTGAIPHLRVGRRFYCTRVALDAWIASHERRRR